MKILFLDYDGCLNRMSGEYSTPTKTVSGILTMAEPELVYRLNLIIDRTGAEIVLSSSWRNLPNWREAMRASGIVKPILGRTDTKTFTHGGHNGGSKEDGTYVRQRGRMIDNVLRCLEPERYAIVDDDNDVLQHQGPNFFRTDPATGLTQEIADAIETHLLSNA